MTLFRDNENCLEYFSVCKFKINVDHIYKMVHLFSYLTAD